MRHNQNTRTIPGHLLGWIQILITSTLLSGYVMGFIREVITVNSARVNNGVAFEHPDGWTRDLWGGTFGTLVAMFVAGWMLYKGMSPQVPVIVGLITFIIGWWACEGGEAYTVERWGPGKKHKKEGLQTTDLSATNIDEFAPFIFGIFPLFWWECPYWGQLIGLGLAFLVFRILDGKKPSWVKYFEDKYEGTPFGVMIDDVIAMAPITLGLAVLTVIINAYF